MKYVVLMLIPVAFCLGLAVGKAVCLRKQALKPNRAQIDADCFQARLCRTVLTEIRENRVSSGAESLEFALDCAVSTLWHEREKADERSKAIIDDVLREIKAYREKWPRKSGAEVAVAFHNAEIESTVNESREILSKVSANDILSK